MAPQRSRIASFGEHVYTFSPETYPFQAYMTSLFKLPVGRAAAAVAVAAPETTLRSLHTFFPGSDALPQITFDQDTRTDFHKMVYQSPEFPRLVELYRRFVKEEVLPLLADETGEAEFLVQREPSVRIHLPNNTALGRRAKEAASTDPTTPIGMHCDADYNHPANEINFVLTVTGQEGTNSFYVETSPGKGDFVPVPLKFGELFRFYGNRCRHYNRVNHTGDTRISLDFRVIPGSVVQPAAAAAGSATAAAVHSGRPFSAEFGGYYMIMRSAQ
jgi:hypothetical protein